MSNLSNKSILKTVNEYIIVNKPPESISKLGFFGSITKQGAKVIHDIDILVFENIILENENELIDLIINSITKKNIENNSILTTCNENVYQYLVGLSNYLKIPFRIALGPVMDEPKGQYLHINASFNLSLWGKFSQILPIHSSLISNNYIPIIGDKPDSVKLSKLDFVNYIKLMDARFVNYKITESYLRKLIKSLALLHDFNSSNYNECLIFLVGKNIITNNFKSEIDNAKEQNDLMKIYEQIKLLFYV